MREACLPDQLLATLIIYHQRWLISAAALEVVSVVLCAMGHCIKADGLVATVASCKALLHADTL